MRLNIIKYIFAQNGCLIAVKGCFHIVACRYFCFYKTKEYYNERI